MVGSGVSWHHASNSGGPVPGWCSMPPWCVHRATNGGIMRLLCVHILLFGRIERRLTYFGANGDHFAWQQRLGARKQSAVGSNLAYLLAKTKKLKPS